VAAWIVHHGGHMKITVGELIANLFDRHEHAYGNRRVAVAVRRRVGDLVRRDPRTTRALARSLRTQTVH
jgi:hypothetical protein